MRRVVLLGVVLAALVAAPASAMTVEGPPALVGQYVAAVEWWGQEPPACPVVHLTETAVGAGYDGHGADCAIQIDPTTPACALPELMEHEVGHLLGYQHSDDPNSIMYGQTHQFAGCERPPIEAQITMYRTWVRRALGRCKERVSGRVKCFADLREIRSELRLRWRELAAVPLPHR